jgi:hypothetical protein
MTSNPPELVYLTAYEVLICADQHCRRAIANLDQHLQRKHRLSLSERSLLVAQYRHLKLVPPRQVKSPPLNCAPFSYLGEPKDGFQCEDSQCSSISIHPNKARQHANTIHHWRASKDQPTYWQHVKVQTFFTKRDIMRWFIVQENDQVQDEILPSQTPSTPHQPSSQGIISRTTKAQNHLTTQQQTQLDTITQEWSHIQTQHQQSMQQVEAEQATHDRTGWWSLTKWAEHFSNCNMQYLAHASRVPDSDEDLLKEACRVVDVTLSRSLQGLGTLHRETRRWIRSPKLSEPDIRPLARLQEPNSQERYHNYWRRFICYCIRVWLSQQEHGTGENGVEPGRENDRNRAGPSQRTDSNIAQHDDETRDSDDYDIIDDETSSISSGNSEDVAHSLEIDTMKDARRLLVFTSQQQDLMTLLHDQLQVSQDEVSDEARAKTMLELCRTFIFYTFTGSEFECGLVHFCAILGIDGENNRLRRASDYTYMLAGLVYDVRILAVEILLPSHEREEQARDGTAREYFLQQRAMYLADGTSTPMSTMISLLAYGKHIAMNEGNAGMVSWSQDRQTLYYKGLPIEMTAFQSMIQDVIARATTMLWEDLMWVSDPASRFDIPLEQVRDDVSFDRRGWSFMSRPDNGLVNGARWMQERVVQLTGSKRLRTDTGWKPSTCRRYLRQCDTFLELLLFAIHTTYGQPGRGTEILSSRYQNGVFQDRNIFIIDTHGVLITRYHKSQALLDRPKVIPRWPAPAVFQLLAIWLAYPRTLRDHLHVAINKQEISDYIWSDKQGPWETSRLTKVLQRESTLSLGHRFGTLDYRHIAISIGREKVGDSFARGYKDEIGEIEEPEVEEEDTLDVQAGRGEVMGGLRYGVPVDIIRYLSNRSLDAFRPLSQMWHCFLGLGLESDADHLSWHDHSSRSRLGGKRFAADLHDNGERRGRSHSRHRPPAWRQLFSSSSRTAVGRSVSRAPSTRTRPLALLPRSSSGLRSHSPRIPSSLDPGRRPFPSSSDDRLTTGRERLEPREGGDLADGEEAEEDDDRRIMPALRALLRDPQAVFRSPEQHDAVTATVRGDSPLIVVLPTGGGKTLLAALPAVLEADGVTIFVAPFRALVNDMVQRFRRDGIDTVEWRHGYRNPATMVVVSADMAAEWSFLQYAQSMWQSGLLRRIFIDECHLTFTSSDWRPQLGKLRRLRAVACPIILLTATLPPVQVFELETAMEVRCARIIRASTTRRQHRYTVQRCSGNQLQETVIAICQRQQPHFRPGEKGVIYALSRDLCETLAAALNCAYYHAGAVDRAERLERWLAHGGFIVATSALGTGVNFGGIVFVLHVDLPWSMIDFAQESGRAGRDGEMVISMIVVPEQSVESKIRQGELSLDRSAMAEFVVSERCRRQTMGEYLDGVEHAVACVDLAEAAQCDRCGGGVTELLSSDRRRGAEWEQVRGILDDLVGHCTVCWSQVGDQEESWREHDVAGCPRAWPGLEMATLERFQQQIVYPKNSHTCFRCGISQVWCATGESGAVACQWPLVVTPLLLSILWMAA